VLRKHHHKKRKARSPRRIAGAEGTAFQKGFPESGNDQERNDYNEEHSAQDDGGPEESALNATPGCEHTSRVGARQPAQTGALALQDNAQDEKDREYNQRDIEISYHLQRASFD
jgi:hypothetical protein